MSNAVSNVYQSMAVGQEELSPLDPDPFIFGVSAYPDAGPAAEARNELIATAAAFQPLLAEHAIATDHDRRVSEEVITALAEAGLFKLTVPKRYGGHQADE